MRTENCIPHHPEPIQDSNRNKWNSTLKSLAYEFERKDFFLLLCIAIYFWWILDGEMVETLGGLNSSH